MKKKGFTLIEMLVVLAIIAIILIVAIPSVTKLKTRLTRKEYDTHVRLMKQALDSYTIKNQIKLKAYSQESSCMVLDYKKLTNAELLHEKGVTCEGKVVLTTKGENKYDYEYFLNCYGENDKSKTHPIETYNPNVLHQAPYTNCVWMEDRESDDATLKSLAVEGHSLNRQFSSSVLNYETNIGITETSVKIVAELNDPKASYKIIGDSNLKPGSDNEVIIRVTAEDGTRKEYKIVVNKEMSTSTVLNSLTANVCELEHDEENEQYICTVGNEVKVANITAVPPTTGTGVNGTGTYELVVGANEITVVVTSEDGNHQQEYKIVITREGNSDTTLATLKTDVCEIEYERNQYEYTCVVDNSVTTIEVNATPTKETSRVEVTGTNLSVGENNVVVKVLAEDGTDKDYVIKVTRRANGNAKLRELAVSHCELTPEFDRDVTEYTCKDVIGNGVDEVEVTATKETPTGRIEGTGTRTLGVGRNVLEVKVTAEDGTTEEIYKVTVIRNANSNAYLKSLSVDNYTISPEFNKDVLEYNVTVENSVEELGLNYQTANTKATATVTGNSNFEVGDNIVKIKVLAEDNMTEMNYIIKVHRKSNDTTLKNLGLTGYTITPGYSASTTNYGVTVENNITEVNVLAEKNQANQQVTITGNTELRVGDNNVLVKVKAEDGTEKTYKIVVHRKSNDTTLRNLRVLGYEITPEYTALTRTYNLAVENNVEEVTVEYEKNNERQEVTLTGNTELRVGDNNILVKVKAEDGTEGTYKIVLRKKSNDATLKSLGVAGYTITPEFDEEELNYKVTVGYATEQLPIVYEKSNENAEVTFIGDNLEVGENEVLIKVEAEDGTEKTYKIDAYRKNNEARLSSLTVPNCTISPDFDKDHYTYSCEARYSVGTMTLTGETVDEKATITTIPTNKPIDFGTNELRVVVEAEDSNYTKEYTITVTKNKDTRNKLLYLGVEGFLILTPEGEYFSSDSYEYVVDTESTRLKIVAEADSDVSTIIGLDEFDIGWETVTKVVTVTSQSGLPSQYTITIHNKRPIPPVIMVTDLNWVNESTNIDILVDGEAETGIQYYEYYATQSSTLPTDSTTPTGVVAYDSDEELTDTLVITEDGIWNVYYRLVSNNNNRSEWSTPVVAKVDKTKPVAPTGTITYGTKVNPDGDWYSTDVGFTVTNGSDALSGYKKNTYTLSGATTLEETDIADDGVITITNEGITTITLYGYDNVLNKSDARTYTIKIDRDRPTAPTFTVTQGTDGTNGWYSTNVVVKVTEGTDTASGVFKTGYTLSGDTTQSLTEIANNGTITISNNGETTITAYSLDNAGNVSVDATYLVKIDKDGPSVPILSSSSATETAITATYSSSTSLSGIKNYKCYYGTTENPTTLGTVSDTTCTFNSGTTNTTYKYFFKICAESNSGVTTCSAVGNARYYAPPTITITSPQITNSAVQAASNQKANITWNISAVANDNETYTFKTIDYYNQEDTSTSTSGIATGTTYTLSKTYNTGRHLLMVESTNSNGDKAYESFFFIVREYGQTSGGLSDIAMNGGQTLDVQDPGVYDSEGNPLSYVSGFTINVPKISGHSSGNKDTFDLYGYNGTEWVNVLHFTTNDGTCKVTLADKATSGTWQSSSSSGTFNYPQQTYYKMKFVYWNAHASCVANATNAASYSISYEFISSSGQSSSGSASGTGEGSGGTGTVDMSTLFNF